MLKVSIATKAFFFRIHVNDSFCFAVLECEGEKLELVKVSRLDMGAYLCIASNGELEIHLIRHIHCNFIIPGVPPSVSKRIKVSVDCKYPHNI
jgi:hypothetical protein